VRVARAALLAGWRTTSARAGLREKKKQPVVARFTDLHKKNEHETASQRHQPKGPKTLFPTALAKPKNLFMGYVMKHKMSYTSMVSPALTVRPRPFERTQILCRRR
jgi:hypothetical protein